MAFKKGEGWIEHWSTWKTSVKELEQQSGGA